MLEPRFFYNITLANAEIGKILRDPDTGDVLCFDGKDGFEKAKDYMNEMFPEHTPYYITEYRNGVQNRIWFSEDDIIAGVKIGWSYTQHYVGDVILDDEFEEVS